MGFRYTGLPTSLMMLDHRVEVIGADYDIELVATLNAGKKAFMEEGFDELFRDA